MALFCPPWKPPIPYPKSHRNYAIQTPFTAKTSIPRNPNSEFSKTSISAPAKLIDSFIHKNKPSSSLSYPGESDKGASSNVIIFIKGLAQSTSEGGLKSEFSRFGEVSRVKIVSDKKTKQPLGFAYVWFAREDHAQAAVDEMNGHFFEGRFIRVTFAKPGSCKARSDPSPYKF
ncbi:hypothetical protein ABFS83_07G025500 [Erythranthe nasuta]